MELKINDIQQHLDFLPQSVFEDIQNTIDGRVPHSHILVLYSLRELMGDQCKNYLEVGVHNGGSMAVAMRSKYDCSFYGIDMFEKVVDIPRWQYFTKDNLSKKKTISNINACNVYNHNFKIFEGNSREVSTVSTVKNEVRSVDLLFIDGDHSYQGVQDDFNNYSPLVRSGGYIVFDDYSEAHIEVRQFVDSISCYWNKIGSTVNEFIIQRQ